jgi:hypothetical protein
MSFGISKPGGADGVVAGPARCAASVIGAATAKASTPALKYVFIDATPFHLRGGA